MDDKDRLLHPSDAQWAQIEGAVPQRRGRSGFERKISNRLAFEAVPYRARTGCLRRDLPAAYGEDHTIYMRWQQWVKSGVPQRTLMAWCLDATKREEPDLRLAMIDSTVACAHQHAVGAHKNGPHALGRLRGGLRRNSRSERE